MSDLSLSTTPVLPVWGIFALSVGLLALLAHGSLTLLRRDVPRRAVLVLACLGRVAG